ncbi:uncharacterized protein [Haliotis asinina]|uniref:uncharacterized protein n=1 Tax=Haliotis asinina TaxID=109174 RepID=UPI003531C2E3
MTRGTPMIIISAIKWLEIPRVPGEPSTAICGSVTWFTVGSPTISQTLSPALLVPSLLSLISKSAGISIFPNVQDYLASTPTNVPNAKVQTIVPVSAILFVANQQTMHKCNSETGPAYPHLPMSLAPVPIKYNTLIPWIDAYYAVCSKDADLLRVGFTSGFNLQFTGSFTPNNAPNLRSARQFPQIVNTKLQKEISLGRIAGPFPSCPIQNLKVSPVGLVKKKSDTSSVTTIADNYRLIHHLSHPRGSSVNDGISAEFCSVQYSRFDEAVSLVQQLGKGAQLAKFDVKSAFRLLPVRPEDFHLLGMYFEGNYYFDKCLPFGCSISCALFETFSRFLQWCITKHTHSASIMHYLDDFLVGGRAQSGKCKYLLDSSIQLFRHFGIPIAQEKTVQPTTTIKFLGITIDTISMEIRIPPEKINHLCQEIVALLQSQKRKLKVHQLQSLLGKLYFVCRAVRCGRAFCRRLTDALCGNVYPYHRIRLTNGMKQDLQVWLQFLQHYNGVSVFHDSIWLSGQHLRLFTDASSTHGFGAYFQGSWTCASWPQAWIQKGYTKDMTLLELFPIVVALKLWGNCLSNKKVMFTCDNQAVVHIINKQSSKNKRVMALVRCLVLLSLQHNIIFHAKYISTHENAIADALSRFQWHRFHQMAPDADPTQTSLPRGIWEIV